MHKRKSNKTEKKIRMNTIEICNLWYIFLAKCYFFRLFFALLHLLVNEYKKNSTLTFQKERKNEIVQSIVDYLDFLVLLNDFVLHACTTV